MKLILLKFKLYLFLMIMMCRVANVIVQPACSKNLNYPFNINQNLHQLHQISDAHSECLIQIQKQISENQQNIDILRGHIQDIQHHVSKINNDQKELYNKLNEILNYQNNKTVYSANNDTQQSPIISKLKVHNTTAESTNTIKIIHDTTAYKQAVSLVLEKKQYDQAIEAFQNFIKNYPDSNYQANAHYWLGQLYYNKNNTDKASYYFALVTKNYPKSIKAPDALLKIGIMMQETQQKDKAAIIYRQIEKLYPNSNAAKQAQKQLAHL